jgi:branched-chain amino acid aminotransferase
MIPITLVNGHPTAHGHPAISPLDRGMTLGDGLFETIKVERGVPWYLDRHLTRLEHAAERMGITYPPHLRDWIGAALIMPGVSEHVSLALRVTLTRGVISTLGLAGGTNCTATTLVSLYQAPASSTQITGLSLGLASAPRNERAYTAGLKTTSYAESILAFRHAQHAGWDDALFLDTRGFVAEATTSNIFAWVGPRLVTPPVSCGILPGITRAVMLELANEQGIATEERTMTLAELLAANELFCTSSLRGIAPVTQVGEKVIGTGTAGAQTLQLMASYAAQSQRI